jgi:uncharacterized repeat protein (TIGR01451 family)
MVATPKSRGRRLGLLALIAAAIAIGLTVMPMTAGAVHLEGIFEVDGNVLDDGGPGVDWQNFRSTGGSLSTAFVADGFNGQDDTIFTGGGSQQENDLSSWEWACGSAPSKSDIEHGFASAYVKDGKLYVYFGADRYDPTGGTTNIGFWFMQNGGLRGGSGCPDGNPDPNEFTDPHVDGDVFVFAEFRGGGGDSAVSVYEWQNGALNLLAAKSNTEFCNPASADMPADTICGVTNTEPEDPTSWPYTDNQAGPDNLLLEGAFFEGGINFTDLYAGLNRAIPCIGNFVAVTGSSQPTTGVLKDFASGQFNVCSRLIVKKKTEPAGVSQNFGFSVAGPDNYSQSLQLADGELFDSGGQIKAGVYTVTETPGDPEVWNAPTVSCTDQGNNSVTYGEGGELSITGGQTVTCEFVNSMKPRVKLVKDLDPNNDPGRFDLTLNGTSFDNSGQGFGDGDATDFVTVPAGQVTIAESAHAGTDANKYASQVSCSSGKGEATGTSHGFSIANGESVTCTFTNHRKRGILIVEKIVNNDEGGTKVASDFSFQVNDADAVEFEADGQNEMRGHNELDVDAGTYNVSEPAVDGYTTTYDECSGIVIANAETKTCKITNDDDIPPAVEVTKTADPDTLAEPGGTVTFTVIVHNTSEEAVTLTGLTDDPDDDGPLPAVTLDGVGSCDVPLELAVDATYTCSFQRSIVGGAGDSRTDRVVATVRDDEDDEATDNDDATVTITDALPAISVEKTANPTSVAELGGNVTYTVKVTNDSEIEALNLTSLVDDKFGNLDGKGTCDVPQTLAVGESYTCAFTEQVSGNAGSSHVNTVTATGSDDDENEVSAKDDATVAFTDVLPSVDVTKDGNVESIDEPGGDVIFTVTVWNTSHEPVTLTSLVDSVYGNLDKDDVGNHSWVSSLCDTGGTLAATDGTKGDEDTYACTFVGSVKGEGPAVHENEVTAVVTDNDDSTATDKDTATVVIKDVPPPPPPPPAPQIDLSVTKIDAPDPAKLNGQIGYTMLVRNAGPSTATGVTLADPLPAGTSFVSVKTTQGTCTFAGGLVQCNLGAIPAGGSVTVTLIVRATNAGLLTNEVTVVGHEPETNPANNRASATTLVRTPLVPPKKPKPVCSTLTVGPKSLRVGKRSTIAATVKNRGKAVKGAKVRVRGAGILKSGRTNARGKAHITVRPVRPGIVIVSVPQKLVCGSKRIGVVGVFEPPVTG